MAERLSGIGSKGRAAAILPAAPASKATGADGAAYA